MIFGKTKEVKLVVGILSLGLPAGERGRLSIMIFHRVHKQRDPLYPHEVTLDEFNTLCGWLRKWFNVLPLANAVKDLKAGCLPSRAVSITFDDGYADNFSIALPTLLRHGLTATFFVSSGHLDGGRMWNDTVVESIRSCRASAIDLSGVPDLQLGQMSLEGLESRRSCIVRILAATKYLPPHVRLSAVESVASIAAVKLPDGLMMSSSQVKRLSQEGMSIGAHTWSHPILLGLSQRDVEREIDDGRRALFEITGQQSDLFAYPNGRRGRDYDAQTVSIVREMGFAAAVSTEWRAAERCDDLFELPRYTPWERTPIRFLGRVLHTSLKS